MRRNDSPCCTVGAPGPPLSPPLSRLSLTTPTDASTYVRRIRSRHTAEAATLHQIDKDEVSLRRSISAKSDEYLLDRKACKKEDVYNLMEAAGFSRSNPFYVVPQGRVTMLTNARDDERLNVLKDVAGARTYEEKRQSSLKLLKSLTPKTTEIDGHLASMQTRIQDLENERADLLAYVELDREKRSIEYVIYHREEREATNELLEVGAL